MKIEQLSHEEVGFKPIKIALTIESEEERYTLDDLCAWNVSIPNLVPEGKRRDLVKDVLFQIRRVLRT